MTSDFGVFIGAISNSGKAKKSVTHTASERPSEIKRRRGHLLFLTVEF